MATIASEMRGAFILSDTMSYLFVLLCQVPLKFRYPFLPQIMWYAADKYLRLLERNKKELGLNSTPKTEGNKQDTATTKKTDDGAAPKGKSSTKRSPKSDVQEGNETTAQEAENTEEDGTEKTGRRRSSRVARHVQENAEKDNALKNGNTGKDEEADMEEVINKKKGTAERQAKGHEGKLEVNGESHDEDGGNDKIVNTAEANEDIEMTPWRPVHLTRFEVDGLSKLIERLREWPQAQKNIPSAVEDPDGLLNRLEVCAAGCLFLTVRLM